MNQDCTSKKHSSYSKIQNSKQSKSIVITYYSQNCQGQIMSQMSVKQMQMQTFYTIKKMFFVIIRQLGEVKLIGSVMTIVSLTTLVS